MNCWIWRVVLWRRLVDCWAEWMVLHLLEFFFFPNDLLLVEYLIWRFVWWILVLHFVNLFSFCCLLDFFFLLLLNYLVMITAAFIGVFVIWCGMWKLINILMPIKNVEAAAAAGILRHVVAIYCVLVCVKAWEFTEVSLHNMCAYVYEHKSSNLVIWFLLLSCISHLWSFRILFPVETNVSLKAD